jgi:hypothetical protein
MKNLSVMIDGADYLGMKSERFGDNTSTMAVFLINLESVSMFVPRNMEEKIAVIPKGQPGIIKAAVTFRDTKPGGYFVLNDFVYDIPKK